MCPAAGRQDAGTPISTFEATSRRRPRNICTAPQRSRNDVKLEQRACCGGARAWRIAAAATGASRTATIDRVRGSTPTAWSSASCRRPPSAPELPGAGGSTAKTGVISRPETMCVSAVCVATEMQTHAGPTRSQTV